MKKKYLFGVAIAVIGLVVAFFALDMKQIEYGTFTRAAETGRMVQVRGTWVREAPMSFKDAKFTFQMKDDSGSIKQVVFEGGKPNNFEESKELVCKGKLHGETFEAKEILTKCPSKYEGTADQIKK